ncbi:MULTISPECIES: RluA family pseudouridine synthase [Chitinophagaceae]
MDELTDITQQEENVEELYERKRFIVDPGQDLLRIDKWLQARLSNVTRNKVQQSIAAGFLTVNGKIVKNNYKVHPGDEILLMSIVAPISTEVVPEDIPLDIVYEDDTVLVLNKKPNMVVHPGVGNYNGTLLNAVAFHFQKNNINTDEDNLPRFGMVHRIDKNTTGLIVLAKTAEAAAHLAKQFFEHTVHRRYVAVVWGNMETDEGTVDVNIGRHTRMRKVFAPFPEGEEGKHAVTHWKILERLNYVTIVECRLETGRTHQIRVHMKHIGHTLFNDAEYGGNRILKGTIYGKYKQFVDNCFEICPRVALHAKSLGFIHPKTEKEMLFESELPNDMSQLIEKWQKYATVKGLNYNEEE